MKIYTKTGDDGTTGLADGYRLPKSALRVDVYGTIDELNAIIGIAISNGIHEKISPALMIISNLLFTAGSDIATPLESKTGYKLTRIGQAHIEWLEKQIDSYDTELPPLKWFILPGGSPAAGYLHQARTVCRRAERLAVELSEKETLNPYVIKFLNRLSDYLFTAARLSNNLAGIEDVRWNKDISLE